MALTKAQIDLIYEEVLSRHATAAEQSAFSSLADTESTAQIQLDISTLPEATSFVDPVVRLYQGAFGRLPDTIDPNGNFDTGPQSGFWVNTNAVRNGLSLLALSQAFVNSAEFTTQYGTTAVTPALITAFYQHILGRDPASSEVAAWVATGNDAAHLLIGFTQSVEFIAKSQASIDAFKVDLANGLHPSGPLPPPPPTLTLTSDHDIGGVNEGSTVTFTLQSTSAADFGKTFSYNIAGVTAADIVGGQLAGTVTLDAQGLAHVAVTLAADGTTEGAEALTLAFGALSDSVAVNDTSTTPVQQDFTSKVGETLTGSAANDTFFGVVDRTFANDSGTYSNIVDKAVGGGGFDTLHLVVNQSDVDIVPNADVERLLVTDLSGEDYNLANMKNIEVIASDGSTGSMDFFNVQNLVDLEISNADAGFNNISVTVIDAAGTGDVDVSLENAGTFDLDYFNTSGDSVVENLAIHNEGTSSINDFEGAEILETVTVDGSGDFGLFFNNGEDTRGVTSVDASEFEGKFTLQNLDGGPSLEVLGATGDNNIEIDEIDTNSKVNITTQGGFDTIRLDTDGNNGASVTVDTKDGGATITMLDSDQSDNTTVAFTYGLGTNKADIDIGANSSVTINSAGAIEVDLDAFNDPDGAPTTGALTANITSGDGNDDIRVNSAGDFAADQGSKITIAAGAGNNTVATTSNDGAVVSITALGGNDTINASADDNSKMTIDAGDGNNNVTASGETTPNVRHYR